VFKIISANDAETSLTLFQAVSVFCFSYISVSSQNVRVRQALRTACSWSCITSKLQ